MLESAGGVYVKLGQIAATRVDLLPAEVCDELALLQNRAAPEPADRMRPVLEAELHAAAEQVFDGFDWEPLAAASIGQTYAAQLRTGEAVVVKIQRPDIADVMDRDLAALVARRRGRAAAHQLRTERSLGEVLDQFAEAFAQSSTSSARRRPWRRWRRSSVRPATCGSRRSTAISAPTGSSSRSGSKG